MTDPTKTLDAVRVLVPRIASRSAEIEAARRLPLDLVEDLTAAGCFRVLVPQVYGGTGADLPAAMRVFEELSRADASVGWTAVMNAISWINLGGLPRAALDALYADGPDVIMAGVFSPTGTAVPVDGGYRVSGRWAFASGCQHADWLAANCVEQHADGPRLRTVVLSPHEVEIEDTWWVAGLCGTGSHHMAADGVVVPAERTGPALADPACLDDPLLRMPVPPVFAFATASVALGIARGALEDILALSAEKVPLLAREPLAANPLFQHRLGTMDVTLRAARTLLYADMADAWATAVAGEPFAPDRRARIRATVTWAVSAALSVVDDAYHAGGGSALYSTSSLQRRFRDMHAVTQHFLVKADTLTTVGAVLAGAEVDLSVF